METIAPEDFITYIKQSNIITTPHRIKEILTYPKAIKYNYYKYRKIIDNIQPGAEFTQTCFKIDLYKTYYKKRALNDPSNPEKYEQFKQNLNYVKKLYDVDDSQTVFEPFKGIPIHREAYIKNLNQLRDIKKRLLVAIKYPNKSA
jgi:hypothetical protein